MGMFGSLVFYLVLFVVSSFLIYLGYKRSNKVYTIAGVIIPILIAALRNNVGTDYLSYVKMFETLSTMSISDYFANSSIELGFYIFAHVAAFFGGNHFLFLAIPAVLTVLFYFKAIRSLSGKFTWLAWLLYLLVIFPVNINQVRQGLAMAIVLLAFNYLVAGRLYKSLAVVVIASLFHSSALLFVPILLLVRWATVSHSAQLSMFRSRVTYLSVLGAVLIGGLAAELFFGSGDKAALVKSGFDIFEQSQLLVYVTLSGLLYLNRDKYEDKRLMLLAFLTPVVALLGIFLETYERLAMYTAPLLLILLARLVLGNTARVLYKKRKLYFLIILVCLVPMVTTYYKSAYLDQPWIFPYNFIWTDVPYIPHEKLGY